MGHSTRPRCWAVGALPLDKLSGSPCVDIVRLAPVSYTMRSRYGLLTFAALIAVVAQIASATVASARQIVLVVGTAQYDKIGSLKNPKRDAATIADRFRDLGFEVMEAFDTDGFALKRSAERFLAEARNADLAVFYFAGHGIQLFDRNVLIARDAEPATARKLDDLGLDLTAFIAALRAAGPTRIAIFIDACRDNPFGFEETVALMRRLEVSAGDKDAARSAAQAPPQRGLATVALSSLQQRGRGAGETLILFAAQPGQVSFDGDGLNSYFVEGLREALAHPDSALAGLREALAHPDSALADVLRSASSYVRTATNGQQVPQLVSDWTSDVVLGRTQAVKVRYINSSANSGRLLTDADTEVIGKANRAFEALNGTFIVHASQVFSGGLYPASEAERERAKTLGMVNGFAIDYDLDRDGHADTIAAYVRQVPVVIEVVDKGISYTGTPCLGDQTTDGEEVESVEIALRDMNGDDVRKSSFTSIQVQSLGDALHSRVRGLLAPRQPGAGLQPTTAPRTDFSEPCFAMRAPSRSGSARTTPSSSCSGNATRAPSSARRHLLQDAPQRERPAAPQQATPFRDQAERDRILPKATAPPPRPPSAAQPATRHRYRPSGIHCRLSGRQQRHHDRRRNPRSRILSTIPISGSGATWFDLSTRAWGRS